MKPLAELLQPDPTNCFFGNVDLNTGTIPSIVLEDIHSLFSVITVHKSVPQDVRTYMESIKNIAVFGWFHYPLYTHAVFLSTTALEMALRARFPISGADRRTMRPLMREARKAGLMDEETTPNPERYRDVHAWQSMLMFRNKFLHEQQSTIMTPWMAADFLSLIAEMINALFAHSGAAEGN